jgi:hypothetical protein
MNEDQVAAVKLSTAPSVFLESRTGTTSWAAARLVATSMQLPPLLL